MAPNRPFRSFVFGGLMALMVWFSETDIPLAASIVTVPVFTEAQESEGEGPQTITMSWDHERMPDPLLLQWAVTRLRVRGAAFEPLMSAFEYAMTSQSHSERPTGIVSLATTISVPLNDDGPSAGAALAVGFLAILRGDPLMGQIALVGRLEPTGWIGPVRGIQRKIRTAAHQGYQLILVPRGQFRGASVKLVGMGIAPNIQVREVDTVEEAYAIMTGKTLE